ncbi:MAG: aminoacyl-tRNA hydrolase [Chaenotheca gracillima]|nr:MAG: aminoacyl-tRNA hydrolase [Chaenotheca gracillima]
MAGKRILDAAAIFNASRSVARKHVDLRSQQIDIYSRTSGLAKAVKGQAQDVASSVQGASGFSRNFADSTFSSNAQRSGGSSQEIPSKESTEGTAQHEPIVKEGLEQDHHYERSPANTTAEPVPEGDLNVQQEKPERYPLPDGTIPPSKSQLGVDEKNQDVFFDKPRAEPPKEPLSKEDTGSSLRTDETLKPESSRTSTIPEPDAEHTLSSEEARKFQRQSEGQIPSHVAEQPRNISTASRLSKGHDDDVFYNRSSQSSPVLSSVPRSKIPKHPEDSQGSDEHVKDGQINADVYYSSEGHKDVGSIPRAEAVPEQEQMPEDANTEIFHSPRVAKLLGGRAIGEKSKDLKLNASTGTPVEQTNLAEGVDQEVLHVRDSSQQTPTKPPQTTSRDEHKIEDTSSKSDDVQKLAADLAKDADLTSSQSSQTLAEMSPEPFQMQESRVPSSRIGRLWQYGGLATGMAFGAVSESFRRVSGSNDAGGSLMFSAGNMERLVAKLSRMRGAALKLGQMMSFQDSKMLPAPIQQVLQRVQDSADYMPASQRNGVLASNLGPDWRELYTSFDEVPIAAASIGQVHGAVLKATGQRVAVKVQYPGVANSIDSDLNNLSILLTASRLLPKGLYLDKTIANARTELAWECDYIREAECGQKYQELLADDQEVFTVPNIINEASGREVLTMERMEGVGVTKNQAFTQEQRDWIGSQVLRLCLREITEFNFMQTDPNWTNFLYNSETNKLELLDFGASRAYPPEFIKDYTRLLHAASIGDRDACRTFSVKLGYLTGHESRAMLDAHVTSILTLAEPFSSHSGPSTVSKDAEYDFSDQTITERVKALIPLMLRERLAPPPEETYSLHRKLSGAFLLCAKLGSRVKCREMFDHAMVKAGIADEGRALRDQ